MQYTGNDVVRLQETERLRTEVSELEQHTAAQKQAAADQLVRYRLIKAGLKDDPSNWSQLAQFGNLDFETVASLITSNPAIKARLTFTTKTPFAEFLAEQSQRVQQSAQAAREFEAACKHLVVNGIADVGASSANWGLITQVLGPTPSMQAIISAVQSGHIQGLSGAGVEGEEWMAEARSALIASVSEFLSFTDLKGHIHALGSPDARRVKTYLETAPYAEAAAKVRQVRSMLPRSGKASEISGGQQAIDAGRSDFFIRYMLADLSPQQPAQELSKFEQELLTSYQRDVAQGKAPLPHSYMGLEVTAQNLADGWKSSSGRKWIGQLISRFGNARVSARQRGIREIAGTVVDENAVQ